jgi:hypothetical protein
VSCHFESYGLKKHRKVARLVIWLNRRNEKREIDTRILSKRLDLLLEILLWNKLSHMNFIGIVRVQSFVPKDSVGKFPIRFKSYKNPPFSLYSKGGLKFATLLLFCSSSIHYEIPYTSANFSCHVRKLCTCS